MSITVLNSKPPGETRTVKFDFVSQLAFNESIASGSVAVTVWSGTDPAPNTMLIGAGSISGTKLLQSITGGIAGTIYKLTATVITNATPVQTLVMYGYLSVVGDPI